MFSRDNEALNSYWSLLSILTSVVRYVTVIELAAVVRVLAALVLDLGIWRVVFEDFLGVTANLGAYASSNILCYFLPVFAVEFDRYK